MGRETPREASERDWESGRAERGSERVTGCSERETAIERARGQRQQARMRERERMGRERRREWAAAGIAARPVRRARQGESTCAAM